MTAAALVVLAVVVSAVARLRMVIFGQPVTMPWLFVLAAILALMLIGAILLLVRIILRDGLRLRPRMVAL